jgi:predicted kinase
MEAVILCGVQGAGKTTLYRDRFLETHVRVAMDLLRTRPREEAFVRLCLAERQRFVVDATNPTPADRGRYVEPAREAGFRTIGYLVEATDVEALARNAAREGRRRVAPGACRGHRPAPAAPVARGGLRRALARHGGARRRLAHRAAADDAAAVLGRGC